VGAPDDTLGEVAVAIYRGVKSEEDAAFIRSIQSLVVQQLGPTFAIDEVIPLKNLELSDFPLTTSGKIRKIELADVVKAYRHRSFRRDSGTECAGSSKDDALPSPPVTMQERLISVWERVLGIDESELAPDTSVRTMADSLARTLGACAVISDKRLLAMRR